MQYLLIHGLGQDSSSWDKVISYMGGKKKLFAQNYLYY